MATNTRKIKHFTLDGVAKDGETVLRIRKEIEDRIIEDMRGKGYAPIIDLLPQLSWEYDVKEDKFNYKITIYGTYLGKAKAKSVLGILDGKHINFED